MKLLQDTPFTVGWLEWEPRPKERMLTVAVKATYDIPVSGPLTLTEEQDFPCGDLYIDDDVERGLRWSSDLEPLKPQAEYLVLGSFHSKDQGPVTMSRARVRVGELTKELAVTGDRTWSRGRASEPTTFSSMPLTWERSFGGAGHADNPLGRGIDRDEETGKILLPNLEDPRNTIRGGTDKPRSYGLAPIPRRFRSRLKHAGTYDAKWLAERYPGLAEDVDYRLFLAAPDDQRLEGFFRGDERLELENLHPEHAEVAAQLPRHRAQAFLCREGVLSDVGLRLDTVIVDADLGRAYLIWRGVTEAPAEDEVEHLFVVHQEPDDRQDMAEFTAWYERALRANEDPEAEAVAAPVGPASLPSTSADAGGDSTGEGTTNPQEGNADGERTSEQPFVDPNAVGAKWAHLDQAMTVRAEDQTVQQAFLEARAIAEAARREKAFQPVFDHALGDLPTQKELAARRSMEALELAMARELEGLLDEPEADEKATRVRDALRNGESCAGWDLTGVDLSGVELSGGDFTRAILVRANLSGVHARDACFDGAQLAEAELSFASFHGASFEGALLGPLRAERARFTECSLNDAVLSESFFRGARFNRSSLTNAEITGSDFGESVFDESTLDGADFGGSELPGATFRRSTLVDTWFEAVTAPDAVFDGCDCTLLRASEGANLQRASFRQAKLDGARFGSSDLTEARFPLATLHRADFRAAILIGVKLVGCDLRGAFFDAAQMTGTSMMKSDLYQARFEGATLRGADLRGANLYQAEFLGADLETADLDLANLDGTRLA